MKRKKKQKIQHKYMRSKAWNIVGGKMAEELTTLIILLGKLLLAIDFSFAE